MRGHCKPDFDTKVSEFAMYLRQEIPSDANMETNSEVLTKNEEDLLRKFGKFLQMDRHGKHGKFGSHGHHGKFGHGHGHFQGHSKHGHHGHHGKHGHFHGKFMGPTEFQKMFEELTDMQKKLATSICNDQLMPAQEGNATQENKKCKCDSGRRHWGRHGHWMLGHHRGGRWNIAPANQIAVAAQTEASKETEATQNLASLVETIDIGNSPSPSEH